MKKFSLISESNRPDIEELESYFDFIKDFDFGIRAEIGRNLDHIEIVDSLGHGAQKIRVMIDILTGNLSPNQRNIQDISNIKGQVEKMGWEISKSNYHGLKLRKK